VNPANDNPPPAAPGLGADIVDIARVERAIERHGERFLEYVFTEEERAYCAAMRRPGQHYAARFAAKEAVAKCLGTGIGHGLSWKSVSVRNTPEGAPLAVLDAPAAALLRASGGSGLRLTLSHTKTVALAVALIIQPRP
jgi:holo-[acyl-carrier protein] synthase